MSQFEIIKRVSHMKKTPKNVTSQITQEDVFRDEIQKDPSIGIPLIISAATTLPEKFLRVHKDKKLQ